MKKSELDVENILLDRTEEENLLEVPLLDKVFKTIFFLILILGTVVLARLFYLGLVQHDFYKSRALANVSDFQIQRAPRGLIFDRFNNLLVKNEPSVDVFLIPAHLSKNPDEQLEILKQTSSKLQIDLETLKKKIEEYDWGISNKMLLASDISHDQLIDFSSSALPGIEIESSFKRLEQPPFKFAHLLGYVGRVDKEDLKSYPNLSFNGQIGKSGLEKYYDEYLAGTDGKKVFLKNAKGEILDSQLISVPQSGKQLQTFIDGPFQEYFYDRLVQALKELGGKKAVGLALNPQNGEVLALISLPSFDNNRLSDFVTDSNNPFFNRAIQGLYNPGSTIKPLVAAAALKEKIITPQKEIFSAGYIDIPNPYKPDNPTRFLDWRANGWVDLALALAKSSNIYFYEVGGGFKDQPGLGIEKLKKWWQKFGLDKKTGIDLPSESQGFLPDPQWKEKITKEPWRLGDTYHVAIGQGDLTLTPLGLLNYISVIANGGKLYQPRIAEEIKEGNQAVNQSQPVVLSDLTTELREACGEVQKGMKEAVINPEGTAHLLFDLPVSVAAKSGTAQIESNTKINAFFVGYAPADNPQIAILILVENAREGSLNTVPVAKDVLKWYYINRIRR